MARILYVEDNEDNIYKLTPRLRRNGHDVIVAAGGDDDDVKPIDLPRILGKIAALLPTETAT